jgi:aerobic-type carbon monoxide dehydrogenase small subunit (CoxS/CutS family)
MACLLLNDWRSRSVTATQEKLLEAAVCIERFKNRAIEAAGMDEDVKSNDAPDTHGDVSRRAFIKGVIGSGAGAFSAAYLFRTTQVVPGLLAQAGVSERLLTLNINGQQRRVDVSKQETLAWTLRYKLGLTGTKLGCDRAECGACTVLIDDIPRYSCSVLTHTVRGGRVLTIEGLAGPDGTLHPVQRAVVDEQGFQCAFCMSGFIMSAVGFLKRRQDPTREEFAQALSGNLCRCCDYNKILNSMMRAAEYARHGSNA